MKKHFFLSSNVFILLFLLTGCTGEEFTAVFSTPDGPVEVALELAKTPEERRRGLMFRERIGERHGMLFLFEESGKHAFWMKNTYVSLDIIFLSSDGVVVDILERLPPCPMIPCPTYASGVASRYALEVKAGFAKENRVRKGDRVRLRLGGIRGTVSALDPGKRPRAAAIHPQGLGPSSPRPGDGASVLSTDGTESQRGTSVNGVPLTRSACPGGWRRGRRAGSRFPC